jgi:DNA-binding NarL/FixJ family response regulator
MCLIRLSRQSVRAPVTLASGEEVTLSLLAEGHTNSAIAPRQYLNAKRVRNYILSISTKLEV